MLIKKITPAILNSYEYFNVVADNIGDITLKVFDTNGRFAKKMSRTIISGVQNLYFNLSDLADGTYIMNAFSGDTFIQSFRFEKK